MQQHPGRRPHFFILLAQAFKYQCEVLNTWLYIECNISFVAADTLLQIVSLNRYK